MIAVLAIGVFAVRSLTRERVDIRTSQVSYQDLVKTSSTNGKVELVDNFPAYAQAPGVVEHIYVDVGQKVKAGQLLLTLDDADARARLASQQSALQAAELSQSDILHGGTQDERNTYASDLSAAKLQRDQDASDLAARQKLLAQGAASAAEVADAQHRVEVDDNRIRSVQQHSTQRYGSADRARVGAQIADAKAAVAAAQSSLANENIRSKIDGTVYSIPVNENDYVTAGSDLIYVADLNRLQVTAYFDEPEVGNLAAGQPVKIVWDAKPDIVWHGHVTTPPTSIITYGTRNVGECFITVGDARGDLQPNANVTVTVTTAEHKHVLSVPREALHSEEGRDFVYRVIGDKLVRTPVKIGILNLARAEILSGLAEGDVVALSATTNRDLTDGLQVRPVQ